MKNQEVINLYQKLQNVSFNSIANGKFQYIIAKNRSNLQFEIEILKKTQLALMPEGYSELLKEITEIVQKAIKDKEESEYVSIQTACIEKWKKNKEWVDISKKYDELINELGNQDNDFKEYLIDLSLVESLSLNEEQMNAIIDLIKEE